MLHFPSVSPLMSPPLLSSGLSFQFTQNGLYNPLSLSLLASVVFYPSSQMIFVILFIVKIPCERTQKMERGTPGIFLHLSASVPVPPPLPSAPLSGFGQPGGPMPALRRRRPRSGLAASSEGQREELENLRFLSSSDGRQIPGHLLLGSWLSSGEQGKLRAVVTVCDPLPGDPGSEGEPRGQAPLFCDPQIRV